MMDRVVDHVVERVRILLVGLDQDGVVAATEEVVPASVAVVEGPSVGAVEVAHAGREVRLRGFDDEVVVVSHQAPGVDAPVIAVLYAAQDVDEDGTVAVIGDDWPPVVTACRDVVVAAGEKDAMWAGHRFDGTPASGRLARPARTRLRSGADL